MELFSWLENQMQMPGSGPGKTSAKPGWLTATNCYPAAINEVTAVQNAACRTNTESFEAGHTKPCVSLCKTVLVALAFICMGMPTGAQDSSEPPQIGLGFSVQALSRGRGVPEPARQALQRVRGIITGLRDRDIAVETHEMRIGLEGERQLCITFENEPDAARAWQQIVAAVESVDLINLDPRPCRK